MTHTYCRRGHRIRKGVTAYAVAVWTWCSPRRHCARPHVEDANTRWNPDIGSGWRPDNRHRVRPPDGNSATAGGLGAQAHRVAL